MKKLICAVFLCAMILCSCANENIADLEGYQKYPMNIAATVTGEAGEAKVNIHIDSPDKLSVSYTEPKILCGVCYTREGERTYMSFGDTKVEVNEGKICLGSLCIADLFGVNEASAVKAPEKDSESGLWRVEYNSDDITCVIFYDDKGLPVTIEGKSNGYAATIKDIEINYE